MRRVCWTAVLALACVWAPAAATAKQSVELNASLSPERLGRPTTMGLVMRIDGPDGKAPSPLRQIDLRYPSEFGIALSGLGIETCTAATLETLGPAGCPRDSVMGYGSALGEIPFGPENVPERATVAIFRAENENGQIALLFDAQGLSPVKANIVLPGVLLPARKPFGGDMRVELPLIASLPEAPDVALVRLSATIGPAAGVSYTETVHGRVVYYTPKGVLLPGRCPRSGFPFAADIAFQGGASAAAHTRVRCPTRRR